MGYIHKLYYELLFIKLLFINKSEFSKKLWKFSKYFLFLIFLIIEILIDIFMYNYLEIFYL